MCIMEVRPGQRSSTIAQAMAHNLSTIERDLDLFVPLLEARGETELLETVKRGHVAMKVAYQRFLECFAHEVLHEVESGHDHAHDHAVGAERHHPHVKPADDAVIYDAMAVATLAAERYETR